MRENRRVLTAINYFCKGRPSMIEYLNSSSSKITDKTYSNGSSGTALK